MKKIFTLSLIAIFAVAVFAKPQGMKRAVRQQQNLQRSEKKMTFKKSDAVLASDFKLEQGLIPRRPLDTYPYSDARGALYARPLNSYFMGISTQGYGLLHKSMLAFPFSTLDFKNLSTNNFVWAYQDPATGENVTSSDTDLRLEVTEYDVIGAPVLTNPRSVTDTVFNYAEYLRIGGDIIDWEDDGGWLGACNYHPDWDGFYYNPRYYGIHSHQADSTFTSRYKEQGIDTVKIVAFGERLDKPSSPFILSAICVPMYPVQDGTVTLKIYKAAKDDAGYYELGDQICESSLDVEAGGDYFVFDDLLYQDPETGDEETLIIDDEVFVMIESDVECYGYHMYHVENLPDEAHAYQVFNFTYNGEEVNSLEDMNFTFTYTDGSVEYVSAFAFSYYTSMYYLHNNEDTDIFNAPVEGGDKTFNMCSYFSSGGATSADPTAGNWDITDLDYSDLPSWVTVKCEDGSEEYQGQLYYNGITDVKVTVEPLPEGVEYRNIDILLSYEGAQSIIHVVQGEGGETPVAGDVNGDGVCTASDVTALYNYILYNDDSAIVNGDQNGDGTITASDVTAVYNIILGL